MLNFLSYFLFNLANVILIVFVSSQDTLVFLNYYSIGNGIFTFFIFCSSDIEWITDPAPKKSNALKKAWEIKWK